MWDSGLRTAPPNVLTRAREIVEGHVRRAELVPLAQLATEIGVNIHTLRAAVRAGHLRAEFSTRSVYGRPIRLATREAAARYRSTTYGGRLAERVVVGNQLLPPVPPDYDRQLRALRKRNGLSQSTLAKRIGAANKAVIYQWESRKRRPSAVFWQRLQQWIA
jgi:DNA-binding XRE family transcriptional regulator